MKTLILLTTLLPLAACGHDTTVTGFECGDGTTEVDGVCTATPAPTPVFHQIEHLARPGINEVLLLDNAFMAGYNATAPTFTGVDSATLGLVVDQAKTVLKAIYLGGCLINGQLGLTADNGVHPGGAVCAKVGGAVFGADGETLDAAALAGAQAYADRIFHQFEGGTGNGGGDVMRIDTGAAGSRIVSKYETLCGDPTANNVLLCGGRHLRDDVIDTTYDYFLNGAATCSTGIPALGNGSLCGAPNQVNALVSDGVVFDTSNTGNVSTRQNGTASNSQQGHPNVTTTFPYSATPF